MTIRRSALLIGCVLFLAAHQSHACLWDYDTLRDERRGLPGILEILSGRYEQHSAYFYEQRIVHMNALLARDPKNLDAWDNLAVAYEKTGQLDAAIATILKKEAISPGQYTTYANLGTFEMLKGDFDGAIEHLQKALAINPDAHFGREEYQLKLAIYLRDNKLHADRVPDEDFLGLGPVAEEPYGSALRASPTAAPVLNDDDRSELTKLWTFHGSPGRLQSQGLKDNVFDGIVGMLRYGPGGSAELYLTLGDLLTRRGNHNLAYRAYARALELKHPRAKFIKAVMTAERDNLNDQSDTAPAVIAAERADAAVWVKAYQDFEDGLLRSGVDAEKPENLKPFYAAYGQASQPVGFSLEDYALNMRLIERYPWVPLLIAALPIAGVIVLFLWLRRRRRRRLRVR